MDRLIRLKVKMEQQEVLRTKLYALCYEYLDLKSESEQRPDILLNMEAYELHELSVPMLLYDAGDIVGLPSEIIYLKFPFLDYFECSDPAPLSILKFVEILIEMMDIYQTQWQEFKERPPEEQDQYYGRIYRVIEKSLPLHHAVFSPEMVINTGSYGVRNFRARKMIMKCALVMGLNKKHFYKVCDDLHFLKVPIDLGSLFLCIFSISISFVSLFVIHTIFSIICGIAFFIYGLMVIVMPLRITYDPMTAKEFADKIIGIRLVENFCQHNKTKDK